MEFKAGVAKYGYAEYERRENAKLRAANIA
jgi:hypothetical protein